MISPSLSFVGLTIAAGGVEQATTITGLEVTVGSVPEPASALLVCLGLGGLALASRKLN